jgi:hypothetical protein
VSGGRADVFFTKSQCRMASFIKIEPSTDIHLVLDPNFRDDGGNSLNNLPLKIWSLTQTSSLPNVGDGFNFSDISSSCSFDFYPIGQNFVTISGTTLNPQNRGTAFMQVRFVEGSSYHYLIVRIMVHERLNSWWFGHEDERMSVFKDDNLPHSQPSIYASFDSETFIGDITAHNYVKLQSDNPTIFEVATNVNKPYQGRIRGIMLGSGKLSGSLKGINIQLDIHVIDFAVNDNKILKRVTGDWSMQPKNRHNMLFIGEGFNNETKFDEVAHNVVDKLFGQKRHSPYNLLKDDFNVWSAYQNSHHEGLTTSYRLTEMGYSFPFFDASAADVVEIQDASAPGGKKSVYTLKKLCELVGFSDRGLIERGVTDTNYATRIPEIINQIKTTWDSDATAALLGFDRTKLPPNGGFNEHLQIETTGVWTIYAWLIQTPMNLIPEVKDTFYGFVAGNRQGDKVSKIEEVTKQVTSSSTLADFTRRIREWYVPNNSNYNFPHTVDSRRWATDIYYYENNIYSPWVTYFIQKHITQFNEKTIPPIDNTFRVGQCWDFQFTPTNITTPEINSSGLVCFLINSTLHGRSANNSRRFIGAIIGKLDSYIDFNDINRSNSIFTIDIDLNEGIKKLKIHPEIKINYDSMIAMVAHEFGHSFNLGDEYEEHKEIAPIEHVHRFDNLVHYEDIKLTPTVSRVPNLPQPVDPEKIKWATLHRISQSAKVLENAIITLPSEFIVKIDASDIPKIRQIKENKEKVLLRKMIIDFVGQNKRQLRNSSNLIIGQDLYDDLEIVNISPQNEITLRSASMIFDTVNDEAKLIPAGSILYLPKKDAGGTPFSLIEKEVMTFMKTNKYHNNLSNGRALSENYNETTHDADETKNLDNVDKLKDTPPDIPNFKGPCTNYKMIGIYEGGGTYVGDVYRPTGACKMRNEYKDDEEGEFCFVCKYLIVSRVNPSKLAKLDEEYPESKERKWEGITSALGGVDYNNII